MLNRVRLTYLMVMRKLHSDHTWRIVVSTTINCALTHPPAPYYFALYLSLQHNATPPH